MQLLFKLGARSIKFEKPRLSTNSQNVGDKCVPHLHQRVRVFLLVEVEPPMSEKDIDVKFMLSAIILRIKIKTISILSRLHPEAV